MLAIFGSAAASGWESLLTFLGVVLAIYIFIRGIVRAKNFQYPEHLRKLFIFLTEFGANCI